MIHNASGSWPISWTVWSDGLPREASPGHVFETETLFRTSLRTTDIMRLKHAFLPIVSSLTFSACAGSSGPTPAPAPAEAPAAATAPVAEAPPAAVTAVQAEQARSGENAFLASCTACHASSEFSANAFKRRWSNRTAADLYDLMSATMPEDAPASLAPEAYVDIVAYMLSLNGFETSAAGSAWNLETLERVSLSPLGSR